MKKCFLSIALAGACLFAAEPQPEHVPELMVTKAGAKVADVATWEQVRRPELLQLFREREYGVRPVGRPDALTFAAVEPDAVMLDGQAIRKRIRATWKAPKGEQSFVFTAFIPVTAKAKPAPGFVLICNRPAEKNIDPTRAVKSPFWPVEEIVARGYAALAFHYGEIAPDEAKDNCASGVFAGWSSERTANSWGALQAWAWGASRVMDWIETEPLLDAKHIGVVGHSRGGKTALVAGVEDTRFAMACSNDSGCGGAKLNHMDLPKSESIARITKAFPHWFCKNFAAYAGKDREMDFDQHMFVALMAPRAVAIASATQDDWAGQPGEYACAALASPAWELYGKKGLVSTSFPQPDEARQDGWVSYHLRTGIHNLTLQDWNRYMDFADRLGWRTKPAASLNFAAVADLAANVDPFIGTAGTGHTTPAACVPFGLVQPGPDTGRGGWEHCSGYIWGDKTICGFSQTHLNGTGCPDLGDVPILPFRGENPDPQAHDKATETASPGYYAVTLKDAKVRCEMTATPHVGLYRFTYDGDGARRLLVDCQSAIGGNAEHQMRKADVALEADKTGLAGQIERSCWVNRTYSFAIAFDRPYTQVKELPRKGGERAPRYVFDFDLKPGETLQVKVALSAEGDVAAAKKNLAAEAKGWRFDEKKKIARWMWNVLLARAEVDGDADAKKSFYTSLFHLFMQPNNLADVGQKPFFSTFSSWDTFRAAHPFYTLIVPDAVPSLVDSMLEQGRRTGYLPIWTLWGKDNQCMIGTHSVPVIVDAYLKGLLPKNADPNAVFEQIKETLTKPHPGRGKENWDLLDKYGYYPFDLIRGESVSRTFECAYDDSCAAAMAEKLGRTEDAAYFKKRSSNWKNVFDTEIGFARGKDTKGNWRTPYDPFQLGHGGDTANDFTEGNAFQYSWHVMQDPQGLVEAMGGRDKFLKNLDALFTAPEKVEGQGFVSDVTGLIGQYAHGNEPSHHTIYFYSVMGRPDRTAERVRDVFDRFYLPKPDGLCGNDDCGQMSAWYVFSAMGFYPFNPCGGEYVLGAPQLPRVALTLPGGKKFTVFALNLSAKNKYVKSVKFNGKPVTGPTISHADILKGGELVFTMADRP